MISLRSKFHLPISRGSIFIVRSENKENIYMADLFSAVNDITPTKAECFSRFISVVGLVSVSPQYFLLLPCHY